MSETGRLKFPSAGDVMEMGASISVIDSGFMPFIPLSQQYKMDLTKGGNFTVPVKSIKKEVGRAGTFQWAYLPVNEIGGESFQPNIDRYNEAESRQGGDSPVAGYGERADGDSDFLPYDANLFLANKKKSAKGNRLADDLRFTPDRDMAAKSALMAEELAKIVNSYQVSSTESKKETAEMEEEALLDQLNAQMSPVSTTGGGETDLQAIMTAARKQAKQHEALAKDSPLKTGKVSRSSLGLSQETYDWSHKDIEDLTKMYALLDIMRAQGVNISNRVIGLEVTKDENKFMGIGFQKSKEKSKATVYKGAGSQEAKQKIFAKDVKKFMNAKRNAIMARINKYYRDLGHGFDYQEGAGVPSGLDGFTMQVISRAREALMSPPAPGATQLNLKTRTEDYSFGGNRTGGTGYQSTNTWLFEFPMGGVEEGGPYIVTIEMMPEWDADALGTPYITGINYDLGIIPMGDQVGGDLRAANMANLILKHLQQNLQIGTNETKRIMDAAASWVGNQVQVMADRGNQLGSRFFHDMGMIVADSFRPFVTIAATMTNRDIADELFTKISQNMNNPEMHKELARIMTTAMGDSSKLTDQWKKKVGAELYTVGRGYPYANANGPFVGGMEQGQGVGVTPLIGASSQQDLIQAIQDKNRKGAVTSLTARRMTGLWGTGIHAKDPLGKLTHPEILFSPKGLRQKQWMAGAWETIGSMGGARPSWKTNWGGGGGAGMSFSSRARNYFQESTGMVMRA